MFDDPTLHAASIFAATALILTLIGFAFGSMRRRGLLPMLLVVMVGLLLLVGREQLLLWFDIPSGAVILRELGLTLIAIGVTRVFILFVFQTLFARRGIPKILDEFVMALVLVGYALFRLNAVGVNPAGLITTSTVITGALAFSAQSTLGNLWGGISLQVEKTCRIGDWIRFDNVVGQVVSIRWRYTAIATNQNETIIIPNSQIMNNRFTLVARRGEEAQAWVRYVPFDLEFDHSPARVLSLLDKAFADAEIPNVSREPPPRIGCMGFKESGMEYAVEYRIIDPYRIWETDSAIRAHLFAAVARSGLGIPFPRRVVEMRPDQRPERAQREHARRLDVLASSDLFSALTAEERDALAPALRPYLYAGGDVVFHSGEPADSLYLLAEGALRVVREDKGARHELARLTAPSYFGEMGLLLGQPRGATVLADGEALCYRLDKKGFDAILQARPELAENLARVLAQRQAANDATFRALDAEAQARHAGNRATDLVRRIRHFFGIEATRRREPNPDAARSEPAHALARPPGSDEGDDS
jgi:small-conductance mechanosensitive channel/CRP-like cAMP-binding protein